MNKDQAEAIAISALGWIAASDEMTGIFLGATGASLGDIRAQIKDPAFQGSVLDFLMMDDAWVREFCDSSGFDYMDPQRARQMLPGGDLPNWT
ncbi:DUF3572 domain-containing protein [Litoreibacter roseus]|uniref:DUF3572 family protein n=1 Tax=Litoreibacter roseus TaxID=2601869 RepID=A0A6N6JGG2_9RHOB|nr:DUF3572 domain-containing protein [Litoreibacter roseus]GFE65421.1 hypothetical protein KIN_24950 [Litoreibacter roseus]